MVYFKFGIVGVHPANRKFVPRPPKRNPAPKLPQEEVVIVETISVEDVEAADEILELEEAIKVIEVEPVVVEEQPPKKKLKDITPEERRDFYRARAEKARETRLKNQAIAASEQE
jgi:hypothetical protein